MKVLIHLHLFFLISCSNVTNTFDYVHFEKVDSILVKMPYAYDWYATMSIQAYERDGGSYIMISDIYKKKLIEINRRSGLVSNVVDLDFMAKDRFPIFLFHYINIDSILILRDPNFDRKFMDSAFFFVNMQGEKFGHIDLSNSQMNLRYESVSDSGKSVYSHLFHPLSVIDANLIIHTVPFKNFNTDFQLIKKHNIPYFGRVNIRSQPPSYNRIDYYPNFEVIGNYPRNQKRLNYIAGDSNEIIFSYPFEVHPKKYNYITKKLVEGKTYYQDFLLIDAPSELPDSVNEQDFEFVQHSFFYSKMIYDKKKHNTFRFVYLPFEIEGLDVATINKLRINRVAFSVYDSNMTLIAEGVKPKWFEIFGAPPIFLDSTFLMMSHSSEENKTELKFIEFKPVINSKTRDFILMKRDSLFEVMSDIDRQLKSFDLTFLFGEKNYPVFILPTMGCPTCLQQYLQLFYEYIDDFYEHNIQLVFSSSIALNFEEQFINLLELSQNYDNIHIIGEDELGKILPVGLDRPVLLRWKNNKAEKVRKLEVGENTTIFEIIQSISQ